MSSHYEEPPSTKSEQTQPRDDQQTPNRPDEAANSEQETSNQGSEYNSIPTNGNDKEDTKSAEECSNANTNIKESVHSKMKEEDEVHSEDKTNVNGKTANTIQTIKEDSIVINDNTHEHKKIEDGTFVKKLQNPDIKLAKDDGNTDSVSMPTWREYFGI